jgi:DNA-binding NarL/FixJ family response regulator
VILTDVALQRGLLALDRGDADTAITLCENAAEQHQATGDVMGHIRALLWLTAALTIAGRLENAISTAEKGIALCDAHGRGLYRAHLLTMRAVAHWRVGETERAGEFAKESLAFHRSLGNPRGLGLNLAVLAWIAGAAGRYERAARLLGTFQTFSQEPWSRRAIGAEVAGYRHLRRYQRQSVADSRLALGDAAFEAIVQRSSLLDVDRALAYALEETAEADTAEVVESVNGDPSSPLTRRQTEVARLVGRGLSNKDIATELVISQRTAEGHVEKILNKLGFGSRAQIAVWINSQEPSRRDGRQDRHRS